MRAITQQTDNENRKRTNMELQSISGIVFVLVLVVASSAYAQQSARVLLQSGLYKEDVNGDLEAAIGIYERVLKDFPKDRPVAAKALLHIGLCYEKLGKQEAHKAYQRLIKEYTDQHEPVQTAREHLERLDAGAPGAKANGPTYRLVLDDQMAGMHVGQRDFSPSGNRIVFGSRDKLYVTDLTGSVVRPILDDMGPWEYPGSLRWSPDGRLIAYKAAKKVTSDSSKDPEWAIFVLSPDTVERLGKSARNGRGQHLFLGLIGHLMASTFSTSTRMAYTCFPWMALKFGSFQRKTFSANIRQDVRESFRDVNIRRMAAG